MKEFIGYGETVDEAIENAKKELNAPKDAEVSVEIICYPTKKFLGLFGGSPAKAKAFFDDASYHKKQQKKNNSEKKWEEKFNKAIKEMSVGNYQNAESGFYNIKKFYDEKKKEIEELCDRRSNAFWKKDSDTESECTEKIKSLESQLATIEKVIADIETGYAVAVFRKKQNNTPANIARVLGVIRKNDKEIKDETVLKASKEIIDEYALDFAQRAKEHYKKAQEFIDCGDMKNAKMYLLIPKLINYKDSEALFAISLLIVDNDPATYEDILKTLVNTREEIEAEAHRQVANDIIKMIAEWKKARTGQFSHTVVDTSAFGSTYSVGAGEKTTISSDDKDFMDWVMRKSKASKDYDDKQKKGERALNPIGDSDFPADVETFPSSDEIW